jgi:hypothetical protein
MRYSQTDIASYDRRIPTKSFKQPKPNMKQFFVSCLLSTVRSLTWQQEMQEMTLFSFNFSIFFPLEYALGLPSFTSILHKCLPYFPIFQCP